MTNVFNKLNIIIKFGTDCLYPQRCPICDRVIQRGVGICKGCEDKIKLIGEPTCFKCGKKLLNDDEIFCYDCRKNPKSFDRGFAVFEYDSIKDSLYKFKYGSRAEYAQYYAVKTVESLGRVIKEIEPQAFVPVPIHKSRFRKRGYNQAYEYAANLSEMTGIPVMDGLVSRTKRTRAQKELSPLQRQKNLKKAFKLSAFGVKLQRVCVIDDIYTTGSTINAITLLLKQAGIKEVYFITIAIGHGF